MLAMVKPLISRNTTHFVAFCILYILNRVYTHALCVIFEANMLVYVRYILYAFALMLNQFPVATEFFSTKVSKQPF